MKEQLNVRLDAALARQLKQEAQEQGRTVGGIVAQALEAWLAKASNEIAGDSSSPDQQALAALEARVARLEAIAGGRYIVKTSNNDEGKGDNVTFKSQSTTQGCSNRTPTQGLTTAELAVQTGTNKGAWNTWATKASPGDIRHHAQAGSWRLLGKTAPANGGPPRWLWEQA